MPRASLTPGLNTPKLKFLFPYLIVLYFFILPSLGIQFLSYFTIFHNLTCTTFQRHFPWHIISQLMQIKCRVPTFYLTYVYLTLSFFYLYFLFVVTCTVNTLTDIYLSSLCPKKSYPSALSIPSEETFRNTIFHENAKKNVITMHIFFACSTICENHTKYSLEFMTIHI